MEPTRRSTTFGEVFPRFAIELVRPDSSPTPALLLWDGTEAHIESSLRLLSGPDSNFAGRVYLPPCVDPTIWAAIRLPTHASDYGSTRKLFDGVCELISKFAGLPQNPARLAAHTVLASWLSDATATPVCVSIGGAAGPGLQLFRLLSCLYRRPLVLSACGFAGLSSLPMQLCPSLFIERDRINGPTDKLLRAVNIRGGYVPRNGRLVPLVTSALVSYGQQNLNPAAGRNGIDLQVLPTNESLPLLGCTAQEKIANEFQPKLLMYRLRNYRSTAATASNPPDLLGPAGERARWLAACVPDDPELQKGVPGLLDELEGQMPTDLSFDITRTVVEALLSFCHHFLPRQSIYVHEVTDQVNAALPVAGERVSVSARSAES